MARYILSAPPPEAVSSALNNYSPLLQQLLFSRNISNVESAEAFLSPNYETELHDPFLLNDMDKAVERILSAIELEEKIVIYSDYDCDGIPGGVVLHDFFIAVGYKNFSNYIPHRHYDGFGLHVESVKKLAEDEAKLIITVDCGTSDVEAVDKANELGVDVIITDHHQPGSNLPSALAIVNPQLGDSYPFKGLCGAAVAYKLVQALLNKGDFDVLPGREKWWLDMVGLATIADMVPLLDENRVFAHFGLTVLRKSRRPGLQQLLRKQRIDMRTLTEDDIGFTIGPRINAASRMDNPEDAFFMLASQDVGEAGARVDHLEKLNNERKGIVASMTREAHGRLKKVTEIPPVIVLGNPEWRPSLVGLVANKLAEEHSRPAFVWGRDGNGFLKGSCRSGGTVSVHVLMEAVAEHFNEYGGHHFSGGFGIKEESIHDLAQALCEAHEQLGDKAIFDNSVVIDYVLRLVDVTNEIFKEQAKLAPFGTGNPKPLYRVDGVIPEKVDMFGKGKEHTKILLPSVGAVSEAIAFFKHPEHFTVTPEVGKEVSLIVELEQSNFMGRRQNRFRIIDVL